MTARLGPRFFLFVPAASIILLAGAAGCTLLTKPDRTLIEETGGAGAGGAPAGGGGSGGAVTTTTGGGGTGGAPCTAECCAPSDCPPTGNECVMRTCTNGACGTANVAAGVPVSTQTAGDCQRIACNGNGGTLSEPDNSDTPDDDNACTLDKCNAGVPQNTNAPAGEPCAEAGGTKCDGSGACVECLAPSDCPDKVCTVAGTCAPATCADFTKNSDETDIDCGGVCGATCAPGKVCSDNDDCLSHVCSTMTSKCAAPSCTDGIQNGDETALDCGGACGPTCGPGDGCLDNGDCTGNLCSGSLCLPSCTDGVFNNGETGLDCGGPVCDSTCADGTPCAVPSDCTSDFCVDDVCCDTACDTPCSACSAAAKGSGADGECGLALQGTDPHDDCGVSLPETCGDATGLCSGAGMCEKWPAQTPCGDMLSCGAGLQTNADACDGLGACGDGGTTDCGLYACGPSTCLSSCSAPADCASNAYCAGSACVAKKPVAAACAAALECESAFCADGFCCDTACAGPCQACSNAKTGMVNGACDDVVTGTDPDDECPGTATCDGNLGCLP